MKKSLFLLICAITAGIFSSCSGDIVYSRFFPISSEQWDADSTVCFDYAVPDTAGDYRMIIYMRHTERYPYQNMWLFVGDSLHTDTIEFYLADDRGQWLGDRNHGFIEMPVLLEENKHFSDTGIYHMQIRHGMRDSVLRGVTDIGLEIRSNGKE